jgi:hypothetical protein
VCPGELVGNVPLLSLLALGGNPCGHLVDLAAFALLHLDKIPHELVDVILELVLDAEASLILLDQEFLELEVVVNFRNPIPDLSQVLLLPPAVFLLLLLVY